MSRRKPYDLPAAKPGDKPIWKSLSEKRDPEAAQEAAQREFVPGAILGDVVKAASEAKVSRRGFFGFGAAGAALLSEACIRRPVEKIYPYTKAPEYVIPGVANHYASILSRRGEAVGVLVESHEGRPTKIEGNPDHPMSLGGADALLQAATMDLYDADRSTHPREKGKKSDWAAFDAAFAAMLKTSEADGGAKLRVLLRPTVSPTATRLKNMVNERFPHARIHTYAPVSESNSREGGRVAFGQAVAPVYDYRAARTVLSLDADFLHGEQGALRASRGFAHGRRPDFTNEMNRLYVVEPTYTVTGANADERLRMPAAHVDAFARALAAELAKSVELGAIKDAVAGAKAPEGASAFLEAVAAELVANKGKCIVVAGRRQPAHVHALVAALNTALDNVGKTVTYAPVVDVLEPADLAADLKALADDIDKNAVDVLVILDGNPVYDAPGDVKLGEKLDKVPTSIHLASHFNETGEHCTWHLPMAHELETWGDGRSLDGSWSIQQPLIEPLHGGRSLIEVLSHLTKEPSNKGYDIVRETFHQRAAAPARFEGAWANATRLGLDPQSNLVLEMHATLDDVATAIKKAPAPKAIGPSNLEVTFAPCNKVHDGASANNPWLLELPEPMTKIVWDNAALLSAATAKALGLDLEPPPKDNAIGVSQLPKIEYPIISISREGAAPIEVVAWIQPGQADDTISLTLGWGRQNAGRYGNGRGFDVNPLRTVKSMDFADGVKVTNTGKTYKVVQTQDHDRMEGRPLAIDATIDEFRKNPAFVNFPSEERGRPGAPTPKTLPLWDRQKYEAHKWGMSIDLSACTGCSACVVACIAENNIAFVGKEQVFRGREMHWIRIDRYFVGDDEASPDVAFQPVACVQCEEAPCENVCPVNATIHSEEGLNDMAYNRCIGTRYCANNCPYKVRRFNFLEWRGPEGAQQRVEDQYQDIPETEKMSF
ncbi:MAG TPA: TAT-variant-translocated molybdopterin oxidoreductase, partial [Polyangiaceae bacterium]|nr:TAT-variant-translocated molybdopterin oxidoreductase [Polyangiaceae bacterium]